MTTYAIPQAVPDDCDYLTAGKRYRVEAEWPNGDFVIHHDKYKVGDHSLICNWKKCDHLNGGNWTRVEEPDDTQGERS